MSPASSDSCEGAQTAAPAPLMRARDLVVGHERIPLLPAISADVRGGQLWAVIGPNGAGKSTFLMTIAGLLPPISGALERRPDLRLAYVPQQSSIDRIFPLRVIDVVLSGRLRAGRLLGVCRRDDVAAADRALAEVGLQGTRQRQLCELSGGQQQRVMVARAIASEADLILFDEPTAALDMTAEREVLDLIAALPARTGAGAIMITHLVQEALAIADRVLLVDRDHCVAVAGSPTEIQSEPGFIHLYRPRLITPEVKP